MKTNIKKIYNYETSVNTEYYPIEVIMKTALLFLDEAYFYFEDGENKEVIINITLKDSTYKFNNFLKNFMNSMIEQKVRYDISKKTKNIREMIISRALYSASVEISDDKNDSINTSYDGDLDEIAKDWFCKR